MHNAFNVFERDFKEIKGLSDLYSYLTNTVVVPFNFEDIIRFQLIYSVSALDKLVHDLIRIGMLEIYLGYRPQTAKYKNEMISLELHEKINNATIPPREVILENEIARKFKFVSYQDPDKIAEGLSYIVTESHKWREIAKKMNVDEDFARKRLKLIVSRRNSIAHESDRNPLTHIKSPITRSECEDILSFVEECGKAIYQLASKP